MSAVSSSACPEVFLRFDNFTFIFSTIFGKTE
jgi:hypothetical protein